MQRFARSWWAIALFFLICLLAALQPPRLSYLHYGFHTDDYNYVRGGPAPLSSFARAFDPIWIGWFYRPVFVDWMLAWNALRPHNPVDLHAASLVLVGLAIFGAGALVGRVTGSVLAAIATAALFALAPDMEEAIWWISSGSALLAAVFALGAYHAWLSWRQTGRRGFYWLSLALMVLGMCSKEDVATLPLGLFLFDLYLLGRAGRKVSSAEMIALWAPAVAWTLAYLALDITAYRHLNALNHYQSQATDLWHGLGWNTIGTACTVGVWSLVFNPFGNPFPPSFSTILLFPAIFGFLLVRSRRTPLVFWTTLIALAGALLLPIALGGIALGERFQYVPNMYGTILAGVVLYHTMTSHNMLVRSVGWALAINAVVAALYSYVLYLDWESAFWLNMALFLLALIEAYVAGRSLPELRRWCLSVAGLAVCGLACVALNSAVALTAAACVIGGIFGWRQGRDPWTGAALAILMLYSHRYTLVLLPAMWVYWAVRDRLIAKHEKREDRRHAALAAGDV